jgi:hypothetical protein
MLENVLCALEKNVYAIVCGTESYPQKPWFIVLIPLFPWKFSILLFSSLLRVGIGVSNYYCVFAYFSIQFYQFLPQIFILFFYYSYVHTILGSFLPSAPTPSLTTYLTPSLSPPTRRYLAETILPLSLILLEREYKQ